MEGGSGAMEATEPMERDTLEAAVPSLSNEDMEAVSEVSMMPANARIITNSLMLRVSKQTEGALQLKTELEDPQFYYEAIIRVCKNEDMQDSFDGWGTNKSNIEKDELLAAFGTASTGSCVASFEIDSKEPVGKRSRQGASQTLLNRFRAAFGGLVEFVDNKKTVHRAAIMSFALYVPKEKGGNLAGAFGGQVVLIAYVFDSTTVSNHFVVRLALHNPRSAATVSCVPHAVPQTLFRSSNVDVAGFPSAVVVDNARINSIELANAEKWKELNDEDLENFNRGWWNCTVLPGAIQTVWDGVSDIAANNLAYYMDADWCAFKDEFNEIPETTDYGNGVFPKVNVALNEVRIECILDCNERFTHEQVPDWFNDKTHKALDSKRFKELSWLSYASLPTSTTSEKKSSSTTVVKQEEKQKLTDEQILTLNDAEFLKNMLQGGVTSSPTIARMQLSRLLQKVNGDNFDNKTPKLLIWSRFLSILHEGSEQLPSWVDELAESAKVDCKQLADFLQTEDVPESMRFGFDKVESIKNKIDAIVKPVPKPKSATVDVEKEPNNLVKTHDDQTNKKRSKGNDNNMAAKTKKLAMHHAQEEDKRAVPSVEPMDKLGKIADMLDKNLDFEKLGLQKLDTVSSNVSSLMKSVDKILEGTEAIQTKLSAAQENATLKAENTKLKNQIELLKTSTQIMNGFLVTSELGRNAMTASRYVLAVKGMGFDEAELNKFFPAVPASNNTAA